MTGPAALEQLDGYVAAFEQAWSRGPAPDPGPFLPPRGHPLYLPVLREIVRVDLELGWRSRRPRPVADYLRDYPDLASDPDSVREIAFEEYRLRHLHGERPGCAEYEKALGVSTEDWCLPTGGPDGPAPVRALPRSPWLSGTAVQELAGAVEQFPQPGQTVAGFELQSELGRGAFGRVFFARQKELVARQVALKFLPAFFVNEAHALARLQHTHIMPIYSLHRVGKLVALCMPYFGGKTLAELVRRLASGATLPASGAWLAEALRGKAAPPCGEPEALRRLGRGSHVEAALWLIGRLAEGLAHAHERGILHRDLKPANVLVSDEGVPLLLDFNLAEDVHQREVTAVRAGGTPGYMAPEYLEGLANNVPGASVASDLYALGLILYQLLTGRFPYPARRGPLEAVLPRMVADRRAPPAPPSAHNPAVTPGADAIVRRCLAPRPADRYASAADLAADLERELGHQPLLHAREGAHGRLRKWARRHPRLVTGGLAGLAASVAVVLAVCLLVGARQQRRLEAALARQELEAEAPQIAFLLASPDGEAALLRDGLARCEAVAGRYGLLAGDWRAGPLLKHLDEPSRRSARSALAELLWLWARAALWQGGAEEARRLNGLALECAGDGAPAVLWRQRADLCRRAGDEAGAREAEGRLAGRSPQARDEYLDLLDRVGRGQFREAMPLLQRLSRQEGGATAWLLLAAGHAELGRLDRARVCAEVAASLAPQLPWAWYRLGVYALAAKDHEQARSAFERALALRPGLTEARVNLALALLGSGRAREAEGELTLALEQDSSCTRTYFIRARARHAAGDPAGARADHEEGLRREPTDEQSYLARSFARLPADPKGALADLDRALALNPRSAVGLRNRAHVLAEYLQRPRDALADLDRALELRPADLLARAGRAVLRARLGQRDGAHADARLVEREATEAGLIYQAACAFALTSPGHAADRAEALRLLGKALRLEERWAAVAERDADLAALRQAPAFSALLRRAKGWHAPPSP